MRETGAEPARRRNRRRVAPVTVLTVCIGNICRSPLAEQLLRAKLPADRFEFGGAGLRTRDGIPMDQHSAEQSLLFGGDPRGARSTSLTDNHALAADLILVMTVELRDDLIRRHPRALRRTFTLAEFTQLLELCQSYDGFPLDLSSPDTVRQAIEFASRMRSQLRLSDDDDVTDPVNASLEVHQAVAAQISGYVDRIVAVLR